MRKNKNFQKLMIYAIAAFMLLSAMSIVANAAFVEIGTGTSNSWYPTYGYYDYSYHACIYTQSDIGAAIDINKISYNIADYSGYTNTEYTIYNQEIYMTHTTLTTFPDTTPPDPTGWTLVYSGDVHWSGTGWNDIALDTSFSYNGVDNLIVYWENHDGDYQSGDPDFYYTYISYRAKYGYRDGSFPTSGYRSGYCPNIRLHFPTQHDVEVSDIVIPSAVEGYGNIPVHIEVTNNGLNAETFPVNVKINSPPTMLMSEDFESTYPIRPSPPTGWLDKDLNLDGYYSGVYAYNMWGSYYGSSYAHSGTMSMRCEDGGSSGNNDILFTPMMTLNAGVTYELDFWTRMSSSSTSYSNNLEVFIGNAQNELAMTTLLWADPAMYHTTHRNDIVTFTVPVTGAYSIGFWRINGYSYADMYLDDVTLKIAGVTIYDQTVTMSNLGVGATSQANLPDWVVATPGTYEIVADAQLGTDEYLPDNILTQFTTVGLFDGQLDSIDVPAALMGPDPFNPVATVSNQGAMDLVSMPVHATVADPTGGTGTVFEEGFEGAPSLSVFEGEIQVDMNHDDIVAKHGDYARIDGTITWPEDQPGFADPDDWTILNPDNNGAMWHLTDYRSSPSSPTHSMYHGDENTKTYLPDSFDILISPKIHIGTAGGSFSFDIYNDVEGSYYDNVFFGVSPDGMSWGWWFGGAWWTTWYNSGGVPIFSGDVDANGDGYVAFMFTSDATVQYEGAYIDNVQVQGSPYLYDETVYVSLAPSATAQITFPEFTALEGYNDYTISICCEEPKDSVAGNDCISLMFNNNAPVWNARTGIGFGTIQAAIDDNDTIDGDTIMVNDGNFNEDIVIDKSITVHALTAPDCESGTTYLFGTVDIVADSVIFENFYVHPLEYFNHSQAAIAIYGNDVIVRHNTVEIAGGTDGTIKGIHAYATPAEYTRNIEISDNCVHDVINCGGTGGGGGGGDDFFFDFENDDGGWTISGTPDWQWTNTYDVSNYVYGTGSTDNPPSTAYSGTGMWGTVLYATYTNAGAYAVLEKTFDFTGMTNVAIEWYSWEHVFGSFDYCELYANGALVWGPSWDYSSTTWKQRMADLSAYDGMSSVTLEFRMWATTVVAYSGWYIDDISITSDASRFGDGIKDTILSEGFESGVPPSGWILSQTNIYQTWQWGTYPHSGTYAAQCLYDYYYSGIQDEWLITPSMDLTNYENTELDFWWAGSYYWSVSPYDNCDLSVYVSTSGSSGPWTMVWTEPTTTWTNWLYYNAIVDLSAYDGEGNVMLGFQYYGYDGAEFDIDDILVTADETSGGGGGAGYGGAVGIMDQGATWNVDILDNEVYDIHSSGWAYGIEVTPTAMDPETAVFQDSLDFYEDFTGTSDGSLPTGWTTTHSSNWGVDTGSSAGGVSPELEFYWSPSSTAQFYVYTPEIDTTDFTTLTLDFLHYVSHYSGSYTLKVLGIAGGTEYTIEEWVNPTGWGSTAESYTLTTAHGVGASDFQLAWLFSGNSFNINWWDIDNVHLYGSYDYTETVYPWPKDVNVSGNHLYRINLGEGYPCPDDPAYPGVMFTVNYATLPTGGPTPADASEVIAHNNWFDKDCFSDAIAILNVDLQHCLDATDNYYSAPDGPGTYPSNETIYDCITAEPADGQGSTIVNYGPVHFDPWLGLNAVHNQPDIIYATTGEAIFFNAGDSWANPGPIMYFWKFDDGYYSMEETIAHTYTSPGTYDGYLRVHNFGIPAFGIPPLYEWDYFTVIVSSGGSPLSANGGGGSLGQYETSYSVPITLHGTASGGTPPYTFIWDLGDGRTVEGPEPTVVFNPEGRDISETTTFTVTLTVIDANFDTATDTVTVTVLGPDELNVNINAPIHSAPGQSVTFQSQVSGGSAPYTYSWNFGDGITSTLENPVHIYEYSGEYTVTLTVTGSQGQEKTITHTINVEGEATSDSEIKSVKGGFGVKATIAAGDSDCAWSINVNGKFVLSGGQASGTIAANHETTVKLPLTLALGKVQITVTADDKQVQYNAFALGPIFLSMQEA